VVSQQFTYSSFDGWLNDINDGDYAVGRDIENIDAPVLVHNGIITDLSKLNGAENAYEGQAINSKGLVCVSTELENGGLIIDIFNSKVEVVNFPNVSNPQPMTINTDDDFAGTCMVNGNLHGFSRRGQTCVDLGPVEYAPIKLNNAGTLLGASSVTWTWDANMSMPTLNNLQLPATADIMSINDHGAMVGWMAGGSGDVAILFDANGVTDLNSQITAPGWLLTEANAINNAGQIAGSGYLNGANMGFLLDPITYSPFTGKRWPWIISTPAGPLVVSPGVMDDGGGWTIWGGKVPPYGPPDGTYEATIGLAINWLSGLMADSAARTAIGVPALEAARRSIDRLIAQANAPALRPIATMQGGLKGRMRRRRFPRPPRRSEETPGSLSLDAGSGQNQKSLRTISWRALVLSANIAQKKPARIISSRAVLLSRIAPTSPCRPCRGL
jgi:hypothetical protein